MEIRRSVLATAVTVALAGPQTAAGATITVNSTSDGAVLMGSPICTLRLAVAAANQNSAQAGCTAGEAGVIDQIVFDPALGSGTITLAQGEIDIESSVTIDGQNGQLRRGITVSGANAYRIFYVSDGNAMLTSQVTLRGLILQDGYVSNNSGGAVRNLGENLLIENCTLTGNSANFAVVGGRGGALASSGSTTLRDSTVSQNSTNDLGGGLAVFSGTLEVFDSAITGNSSRSAGGLHLIYSGATLTMSGGSMSGNTADDAAGALGVVGSAMVDGTAFANNSAELGGGIGVFGGTLTLTNATVNGNTAVDHGGGIRISSGGVLNMTGGALSGNSAELAGGLSIDGSATLIDVTVENNVADNTGGGIRILTGGSLNMTGGGLMGNTATRGGGLYTRGPADLDEVSITSNTATSLGGGIYARDVMQVSRSTISGNQADNGAALFTLFAAASANPVELRNVTLSANTSTTGAALYEAAVYSFSALRLENSTLVDNSPNGVTKASGTDSWAMINTIISGSAEADCVDAVTPLNDNISNLIEDGSCATGAVGLVTGSPALGPLAMNGGPTLTHQPLTGSPVVDSGNNVSCPTPDQTGMPRPVDGDADGDNECDIGAVEFVDLFGPQATLTAAPDVTAPGATSYELTVTYADADGEVDFTSIDVDDISVQPGPLAVISTALSGTAAELAVTYDIEPPGGAWDFSDGGVYTVTLNPDEVVDTAVTGANSALAGNLGQFQVLIGEIDVSGNGVSIMDGDDTPSLTDGTDFGQVLAGAAASRTFVIANQGSGTINLTAPVDVGGQGFSVSQQPADTALDQGESTTFEILYTAASEDPATGVVTVVNDDMDEAVHSFFVAANLSNGDLIFADGFEEP